MRQQQDANELLLAFYEQATKLIDDFKKSIFGEEPKPREIELLEDGNPF
jgi:hypothetical protein